MPADAHFKALFTDLYHHIQTIGNTDPPISLLFLRIVSEIICSIIPKGKTEAEQWLIYGTFLREKNEYVEFG